MSMIIMPCGCESEYQDKQYGKKLRAFNGSGKGVKGMPLLYRCTVCGKEKSK